jgi:hypothetical protein
MIISRGIFQCQRLVALVVLPQSEFYHLRHCSSVCLFLRTVGLSHLKMSASEHRGNVTSCVSVHRTPAAAVRVVEVTNGTAAMGGEAGLRVEIQINNIPSA